MPFNFPDHSFPASPTPSFLPPSAPSPDTNQRFDLHPFTSFSVAHSTAICEGFSAFFLSETLKPVPCLRPFEVFHFLSTSHRRHLRFQAQFPRLPMFCFLGITRAQISKKFNRAAVSLYRSEKDISVDVRTQFFALRRFYAR